MARVNSSRNIAIDTFLLTSKWLSFSILNISSREIILKFRNLEKLQCKSTKKKNTYKSEK